MLISDHSTVLWVIICILLGAHFLLHSLLTFIFWVGGLCVSHLCTVLQVDFLPGLHTDFLPPALPAGFLGSLPAACLVSAVLDFRSGSPLWMLGL